MTISLLFLGWFLYSFMLSCNCSSDEHLQRKDDIKDMETIFSCEGLCKNYGKFQALRDLNMEIEKGSIYGFVGKNGAGKTTLIRMICGLQTPTSGTFTLMGRKNNDPEINRSRRRLGAVVESPAFYKNMSARDNLIQQYLMLGLPNDKGIDELLETVGLADTGRKKAKNFSLGMRQRLGIALALCGNPDFIILDEPTNGLDPQGIIDIRELILKLNRERGITFLISSHILDELSRLATCYGFIDKGHIVREMSAEELQAECRKSIRMKVSDVKILAKIMDRMGNDYKIIDDSTADVYETMTFSDIAKIFEEEKCTIFTMEEHDESLEAFYLELLGGNEDA